MRRQVGLVKRGGVYYFRARIPGAYRTASARKEIWRSLRTRDPEEARYLAARFWADLIGSVGGRSAKVATTPSNSLPQAHRVPRLAFEAIFEYWTGQGDEKRPRTLMDARTALSRLAKVVSHTDASKVTNRDAIAYKDALLESGISPPTCKKLLGLCRALFGLASANGLIDANPFASVPLRYRKPVLRPRTSFSRDDLIRIFGSPVFSMQVRPRGGAGEASFWIPLIAVSSGMRLEEIGQLRLTDLIESDGELALRVKPDANVGTTVKTAASVRMIPLHRLLLESGIKAYAQDLRAKGEAWLFPAVRSAAVRQRTSSWSQWFGRYLRQEVGIEDRRKTFHSFRHTFKDLCREVGVPKEIHDRLTGHAAADVSDRYGGDAFPARPLRDAVRQIDLGFIVVTPPSYRSHSGAAGSIPMKR